MFRKSSKIVLFLILASFWVILPVQVSHARRSSNSENLSILNDFGFESFKADYLLKKDERGNSYVEVTEELVAVFWRQNNNRGIERAIPEKFEGRTVFNGDIEAFRNGSRERVSLNRHENGNAIFRVGDPDIFVNNRQVYTLKYSLYNAVSTENGVSKNLILNTNGLGWKQDFDKIEATFRVDDSAKDALAGGANCYFGGAYEQKPCEKAEESNGVWKFSTNSVVLAGQNMTFEINLKSGAFIQKDKHPKEILANIMGIVAGMFFTTGLSVNIWALCRWHNLKKRYKVNKSIVPQYLPPKIEDIDILDAGSLVGSPKGFTTLILFLAVNGNIRIIESKKTVRLFGSSKAYTLELLNTDGLNSDLRKAVSNIFLHKNTLDLSNELKSSHARKIQETIENSSFLKTDYYVPEKEKNLTTAKNSLFIVGFASGGIFIASVMLLSRLSEVIAGYVYIFSLVLLVLTIIVGAVISMPIHSQKGEEMKNYLLGLKMYITATEMDRIKFHQSLENSERFKTEFGSSRIKLFEKLLPWAALFGFEKSWSKVLEVEFANSDYHPDWYSGQVVFNAAVLSSVVSSISISVQNSYNSSISSSSGGSGGFSGGGAGGGGGGGW